MKNTLFCPQFSPQNAENRILGLSLFKFSGEARHLAPLPPQGLTCPFWYSRLLYSILLAISIFIETPDITVEPQYNKHLDMMKSSM